MGAGAWGSDVAIERRFRGLRVRGRLLTVRAGLIARLRRLRRLRRCANC